MQAITVLFLFLWVWFAGSIIAHAVWRAAAREELRTVGIKSPAWWSREVFATLMILRDNRGRLTGEGASLIRQGKFFCWNLIAVVFGVLLFILVMGVRFPAAK
jgi:hypothetical protein